MADYANVETFSEREKLAAEYAEVFILSHTEVPDGFFDRLRAAYSDSEIVELSATIGFCLGIGRMYTVLDIAHECRIYH